MKKLACIYFEGNDSKIVLFSKNKNSFKALKAKSIESSQAFANKKTSSNLKGNSSTDVLYYDTLSEEALAYNNSYLQKLSGFLAGENLKDYEFIPILTEPGVHFHKINSEKDLSGLNVNAKGKGKDKNKTLGFIELTDNSKIAVYPSGQVNYLQALDSLAKLNGMRHLKTPRVKCAEVSLANYIIKKEKVASDTISLIIYFGKEYTKLIFMKGEQLLHLGATLSVGKNNGKINNVVISKILFEREHASINSPDNILICGEKVSEEFNTLLKGSYPDARVKKFPDDLFPEKNDNENTNTSWSQFTVPVAVAQEYFDELNNKTKGIDLLPSYIREQQKSFQLAWHGVALFLGLFAAVMLMTYKIFINEYQSDKVDYEINSLLLVQKQNQEIVDRVTNLNNKIDKSEETKIFLDQISAGTGMWVNNMEKLARFTDQKRNIWLQNIKIAKAQPMVIEGFSTSRWVLPELKRSYSNSSLQFLHYEPMRDRNTYEFNLKVNTPNVGQ